MESINKIKWAKEEIKFIRKNYSYDTITKKELLTKINKRFKKERTLGSINAVIKNYGLQKPKEFLQATAIRGIAAGRKRRELQNKKLEKKVCEFLKSCAEKDMTKSESHKEAQIKFEAALTLGYIWKITKSNKIRFITLHERSLKIDLPKGLLEDKGFERFIKAKKNQGKGPWDLESNIIEKFGFRLNSYQVRRYCRNKKIILKWK